MYTITPLKSKIMVKNKKSNFYINVLCKRTEYENCFIKIKNASKIITIYTVNE